MRIEAIGNKMVSFGSLKAGETFYLSSVCQKYYYVKIEEVLYDLRKCKYNCVELQSGVAFFYDDAIYVNLITLVGREEYSDRVQAL